MASATNSRALKRLRVGDLHCHIAAAASPVALLVLRLPDLERMAWRAGKTVARRAERLASHAFACATQRVLRAGDVAAHDPGSDLFAIALTAPSRAGRASLPSDHRAILERIAAALSFDTIRRAETGWTLLQKPPDDLGTAIERALERGARERERYEFFAAVGHELRTPLSSIRGYLETLLESPVDPGTARRFLSTAQREATRMGRLLDGMLEFSLLDLSAGVPGGCDVDEAIESACDAVRPGAQATGAAIVFARRCGARAAIDPDAFVQMIANLLENAAKHGTGTVQIRASARGKRICVTVDDSGPGIAPDEREAIFAMRRRGSAARFRPGAGIGLAIVKLIAERAGGTVRAGASPLGGARFEVLLPVQAENSVRAS